MKFKKYIIIFIFILTAYCFNTITNKTKLIQFKVPPNWPKPKYNFSENVLTEEGFELGKIIFYDANLSADSTTSCASCHQQFAAFSTYDHNFSHGIGNKLTTRNATALQNLAWQPNFMSDGSIHHLNSQPLFPFTNSNEMGLNLTDLLKRFNENKKYKKLFFRAFNAKQISLELVNKALAQFMLQLVSSNSKYDRVIQKKDSFTLPEKLGYEIFKNKCANCHIEPLFTNHDFKNIGLPNINNAIDNGRMNVTQVLQDSLKFRVPSLRNVVLTKPYMHDGRFSSLYSVFEHYRKNMIVMKQTDSNLITKIRLSNFEIGQLTAFLYTLTDSSFINNKMFAPNNYNIIPSFRDKH